MNNTEYLSTIAKNNEPKRKNTSRRLKHKKIELQLFIKNVSSYDFSKEREIYKAVYHNLDLSHKYLLLGNDKKTDIKGYIVDLHHTVYKDGILLNLIIAVSYYTNIVFSLCPFIFDLSLILNVPSNLIIDMNKQQKPPQSVKKQYINKLEPVQEESKEIKNNIVSTGSIR